MLAKQLAKVALLWVLFGMLVHANAQDPRTEIPPNFRGKITYKGQYVVQVSIPIPAKDRSSIRLGGAQISLGATENIQAFKGAITIDIEYDALAVVSGYKTTGVLSPGQMSGVRTGDVCEFTDTGSGNTTRTSGTCNSKKIALRGATLPGSKQRLEFIFEAEAVSFIDYAERDRRDAELKARSAIQERSSATTARDERRPPTDRQAAQSSARDSTSPTAAAAVTQRQEEPRVDGAAKGNDIFTVIASIIDTVDPSFRATLQAKRATGIPIDQSDEKCLSFRMETERVPGVCQSWTEYLGSPKKYCDVWHVRPYELTYFYVKNSCTRPIDFGLACDGFLLGGVNSVNGRLSVRVEDNSLSEFVPYRNCVFEKPKK